MLNAANIKTSIDRRRLLGLAAFAGMLAAAPSPFLRRGAAAAATADVSPSVETLEATAIQTMRSLSIPGANVLVDGPGMDTWTAGIGISDLQNNDPMQPDMHLRIGSITKTMTATAVLQLVDEGTITLDDTLASLLPDVTMIPNAAKITVRQLLSMTSGIFDLLDDESFFPQILSDPTREWSPEEMIDLAGAHDPVFAPGADFAYSNTNYILLGMIIERLTGQTVAHALDQRIFSQLGMTQTSLPNGSELPTPFAHGYGFVPNSPDSGTASPAARATPNAPSGGRPRDLTLLNASIGGAAGGIVSTVGDLQIWLQALVEGSLLSDELQRERLTFRPVKRNPGEPSYGYGLGIANFDGMIGHDGDILGFQSMMGRLSDTGDSIIVLANISPTNDGADAADAIAQAIRPLLSSSSTPLPVATP